MHTLLKSLAITPAAALLMTGCGGVGEDEQSAVGSTFQLTKVWCNRVFSNSSQGMSPGECGDFGGMRGVKETPLRPGTCITLGEVVVTYPKFNRTVEYEVSVAGISTRIAEVSLPLTAVAEGIKRRECRPGVGR